MPKPPDLQRFYTAIADAMTDRAQGTETESDEQAEVRRHSSGDNIPGGPPAVTPADVADARDQLQSALESEDPPAVAKAAHRLAGVAAFANFPQMTECARHIEDAAWGGDLAAVRARFEAMPSL